jgi:uncharacterized protein YkwD
MHLRPSRRPRRVVARTLGFGISALAAAALISWTPAVTSAWNQGSAEATLWQLLNGARTNNGRAPLQQNATLVSLARWRSSDMLAKDYFSHTIAGCGCLVYAYYDSNGLNYDWAGENIGWNSGQTDEYSPVRVHEQFMGSPGHRQNVLDPSFTHGGVGASAAENKMFQGYVQNTRMYTELFMQARGASAPPQPAPQPPPPGGGGGQPAPRPVTPAPTPAPKVATMDAPQRPTSTAGIDGVAEVVSAPSSVSLIAHLRADEMAASRIAVTARGTAAPANGSTAVAAPAGEMEVSAAEGSGGLFEGVIGALLGLLFG